MSRILLPINYVCPQALPVWVMPDGILFLLRLEFMSKEISFTSMNSEGGTTESQIHSFKSDLRCHLSQTTQHRSHSFVSMAWRLVLRDRFTLPKIFQDANFPQFAQLV